MKQKKNKREDYEIKKEHIDKIMLHLKKIDELRNNKGKD